MEATAQKPLRYVVAANVPLQKAKLHDGTIITANATLDLRRKVTKYLLAIDYRPDNFERYFGNAVCEAWPDHVACHACRFVDDDTPEVIRRRWSLRLPDILRFIGAAGRWLKEGKCAPREQARARARVCMQCKFNQRVPGCFGCAGATSKILGTLAGLSMPEDSALFGCEACGCELRTKCWLPSEAIKMDAEYPSHCWVPQEVRKAAELVSKSDPS